MARDVDERKKRKVLNRIRRAKAAAERAIETSGDTEAAEAARRELSDWEDSWTRKRARSTSRSRASRN